MLRNVKLSGCLAAVALSLQSAFGFVLLGPVNEGYQTTTLGYNFAGDIGAPKNIGEEYRWNTPVVYYAFDQGFYDYFGSNGVYAVDQAFGILNALTNTPYSSLDLDQFPLESYRINSRAASLNLYDVKTEALWYLTEGLGLAEPDRYVWTLRSRICTTCPACTYDVIMRNFDPYSYGPTPYINGILYTYYIEEFCTAPESYSRNFPVDPTADIYSALMTFGDVRYGAYATGLSRDDVGGLKYLMRTNNVNWESASTDSILYATNNSQAQLLYTTNLSLLSWIAETNDAVTLANFFPGIQVASTTNLYVNTWITNIGAFLTNFPWDSVATPPHIVYVTNLTFTIQTIYRHTFGNLLTFSNYQGDWIPVPLTTLPPATNKIKLTVQTDVVRNAPWLPAVNPPVTNSTFSTYTTNGLVGEVAILPTNACSMAILGVQAVITNLYTNIVLSATNALANTNVINPAYTNVLAGTNVTGSNTFTGTLQVQTILKYTNHVFLVYPVECLQTNASLYQGIDRISFVRSSFDSLIGRFYRPITNVYSLIEITNSVPRTNWFQRPVVAPDILFDTADLLGGLVARGITYVTNNQIPGLAGPGTIAPFKTFTFNRVGPLLINSYSPAFVDNGRSGASTLGTNFVWGSFDGSTNDPIVYPTGTRLGSIENQIIFQITADELPDASVGVFYAQPIPVTGGQPPYSWAPTVDSAPLPPGLVLASDGTISGAPEEIGDYTFTVSVTEAGGRTTVRTLTLTVKP